MNFADGNGNNVVCEIDDDRDVAYKPIKVKFANDIRVEDSVDFKPSVGELGRRLKLDEYMNNSDLENYYYGDGCTIDLRDIHNVKFGERYERDALLENNPNYDFNVSGPFPYFNDEEKDKFNYLYKIPFIEPPSGNGQDLYEDNKESKKMKITSDNIKLYDQKRCGGEAPWDPNADYVTDEVHFYLDIPNYIGRLVINDKTEGRVEVNDDLGNGLVDFKDILLKEPINSICNMSNNDAYYLLYDFNRRVIYVEFIEGGNNNEEEICPSYLLYQNKFNLNNTENVAGFELESFRISKMKFEIEVLDVYDRLLYKFEFNPVSDTACVDENDIIPFAVRIVPQYIDQMSDNNYKRGLFQNMNYGHLIQLTSGNYGVEEGTDGGEGGIVDYDSDDENVFVDNVEYVENSTIYKNDSVYPHIVGGVYKDRSFAPLINKEVFKIDNSFAKKPIEFEKGRYYILVFYSKVIKDGDVNRISKRYTAVILYIEPDQLPGNETGTFVVNADAFPKKLVAIEKNENINTLYVEDITENVEKYLRAKADSENAYISVDLTLLAKNNQVIDVCELGCKAIQKYESNGIPGSVVIIGYNDDNFDSKARFIFDLKKSRYDFNNGLNFNSDGIFKIGNTFFRSLVPLNGNEDNWEGDQTVFKKYYNNSSEYVLLSFNENYLELYGSQFFFDLSISEYYVSSLDNRLKEFIIEEEGNHGLRKMDIDKDEKKVRAVSANVLFKNIKRSERDADNLLNNEDVIPDVVVEPYSLTEDEEIKIHENSLYMVVRDKYKVKKPDESIEIVLKEKGFLIPKRLVLKLEGGDLPSEPSEPSEPVEPSEP